MPVRNFAQGEYYHCYNRGVDKRTIFYDRQDFNYFLKSMYCYNSDCSRSKLRLYTEDLLNSRDTIPIVAIAAYCLNPNHFHILIKETSVSGISKFMQKLGTGYTMYFNEKYKRSGGLFEGAYKARHINDDTVLRHVAAYINLNNEVHGILERSKFRSSYHEFVPDFQPAVRGQTSDLSRYKLCSEYAFLLEEHDSYEEFARASLTYTKELRASYEKPEKSEFLE